MIEVRETDVFAKWFSRLRDDQARARVSSRIDFMREGHFGDVRPVGGGVSELRIHHGPGYRLYFAQRGDVFVLLLSGGIKDSQERDIRTAKVMARRLKEEIRGN